MEKEVVLDEVKKIAKEFNRKEKIIEIMLYKAIEEGYNKKEGLEKIKCFYNSKGI